MNDSQVSWAEAKIGDLIALDYGRALADTIRSGDGYPVYGSRGVVGKNSIAFVDGPGIVVGRKGTVGAITWSQERFWPIDTTYYVRWYDETLVDRRWTYWYLSTLPLKRLDSSTGVPGLNRNDAYELNVLLPPIAEQRRIAEILDTVDEAIRSTERLIAKLEQTKQGLLYDLLTRGIDEFGHLRDRRRDAFVQTPLGPLPGSWRVEPVGALLADVNPAMRSGPFGSALLKSELVNEGIPMLGIDNVEVEHFARNYSRFVSYDKYQELTRYTVRPRDVMVTIMGTVGRCCVVPDDIGPALSSKHVWTLTFDQNLYLPELACLQINYSDWVLRHFARDVQGGIMSAIRSDTLRTTLLPVPQIAEQRRIVEILRTQQSRIEIAREESAKLRLLKQGLMDDLLTGRVRVSAGEGATV